MFDTMTFTKLLGGVCGTLLIFMLAKWGGETLYSMEAGGHGPGDDHGPARAYVIATDDGHGEDTHEEEGPSFAEMLAAADVEKGAKVWSKCKSCHSLEDGKNGTGPHLAGIVGRAVESVEGFGYSGAQIAVADVWTPENLNGFLTKPKTFAPGTKMGFSGLKKDTDRANLIAYLQSLQ